jgi:menaquinone-dependent protoporphyrinogen oxidase
MDGRSHLAGLECRSGGDAAARPLRVLVTAASRHGSTAEIAAAIGAELTSLGLDAVVLPPAKVQSGCQFDAAIIGSAVYAGHWEQQAVDLVSRLHEALTTVPVWLFSSGPVGRPQGKLARAMGGDPAELAEMLSATHAAQHRMFAGKLDHRRLPGPQRFALLFFRGLDGDFRDWAAIGQWAKEIAADLEIRGTNSPDGRVLVLPGPGGLKLSRQRD